MREKYRMWAEDVNRKAEGRGTGEGANYRPWIGVGEFSSFGEEKLLPGKLIRRLHTTHSQIERAFLEVIETKAHVADIREQYPLDIAETYQIAKDLVIIHPRDYKTKADLVMTTDFLIVRKDESLGGIQGDTGYAGIPFTSIGYDYEEGDITDYVFEAFAGPHDFRNDAFFYDPATGNIRQDTSVPLDVATKGFTAAASSVAPAVLLVPKKQREYIAGELVNAANVVVATPFVLSSVLLPTKKSADCYE